MLREGDAVPDVTFTGPDGKPVRLRDLLGDRALVVYFYPRDETPICTVESCSFRDAYQDFLDAGAEVVGVSGDSQESHARFSGKHRLPFRLLSDGEGEARKAFGVKAKFGLFPGRVTFVIDRSGVVRHAFDSQIRAGEHVRRALETVRGLTSPTSPARP